MIELQEQKLDVKFKGQVYHLSFPTVEQVQKQAAMEKENPDNAYDNLKAFLSGLGLPEAVVAQLQVNHLEILVDNLKGQKKS